MAPASFPLPTAAQPLNPVQLPKGLRGMVKYIVVVHPVVCASVASRPNPEALFSPCMMIPPQTLPTHTEL